MAKTKVTVVMHNIRSAWNVGSMFRSADAAGIEKIHLGGYSPTPENPKVLKTSLGSEKHVPWEAQRQTWRILERLKKEGYRIVALELGAESKNIFEYKPEFPLVLVVGNEVRGLSPAILKYCDAVLQIPMRGEKESLNVAVAFGIAAYILMQP